MGLRSKLREINPKRLKITTSVNILANSLITARGPQIGTIREKYFPSIKN